MRTVAFPHPGEILQEEFLTPMGITPYRLAKEINVQQTAIGQILKGERALSVPTALRLAKFFGTSDEFWITLQARFEAATEKDRLASALELIKPWAVPA